MGSDARWQLAEALQMLAQIAGTSGATTRTAEIFREGCALHEESEGRDSSEAAICYLNLGGFLIETGARQEGIEMRDRALEILARRDGPDSNWREAFPPDDSGQMIAFSIDDPVREDVRRALARAREGAG